MAPIVEFFQSGITKIVNEFDSLSWNSIKFGRKDESVLFALVLGAVFISALTIRYLGRKKIGRKQVTVPAIVSSFARSPWAFVRHIPVALFIFGLPFLLIALADPYLSFVREETTYPGRRIAVLIDASGSMSSQFSSSDNLNVKAGYHVGFYTAASAAEYFMGLRIKGKYQDLMALIEFGNESYIITPFTNDYQNILTSVRMISEPGEWGRFKDKGTTIIKAINQSVELFQAFDFLKAAGNIVVLISDGEDTQAVLNGVSLDDILYRARKNRVPIYFIRVNYEKSLGGVDSDSLWKSAVEKTGGKFYPAADENSIIAAIEDIDNAAVGKIDVSRYSSKKPVFRTFLAGALILWSLGGLMFLSLKLFRVFP